MPVSSSVDEAFVWHGTPQTAHTLHPAGARNSRAYGTTGAVHAGYVNFSGYAHAGLWTGDDRDSFEDLNPYFPAGWGPGSIAYAIVEASGRTYVTGTAGGPGGEQAVLWTKRTPISLAPH